MSPSVTTIIYLPSTNTKSYMHASITVQDLVNKPESPHFEECYLWRLIETKQPISRIPKKVSF